MVENSNGYGGFNSRRKRNLSSQSPFGIDWNRKPSTESNEGDTAVAIGRKTKGEEPIGNRPFEEPTSSQANARIVRIGGSEVQIIPQPKKAKFEETHVRFTSYLEKDLHQIIQELRREGVISSVTELVNEAVKAYLLKKVENK
jgi:hypothetical protein